MVRFVFALLLVAVASPVVLSAEPLPAEPDSPQPAYRLALHQLQAPDADDPEAVWRYITRIAQLTADQMPVAALRRSDPQQAMLDDLADEHMDALIEAHRRFPVLGYYLQPIVQDEIRRRQGPDFAGLKALRLPPTGNDAAAVEFLDRLERLTQNQHRLTRHDPQVDLLLQLLETHPQAVIGALDRPSLRYHVSRALDEGINDEHKDMVVAHLLVQPRLIRIVVARNWEPDARQQIELGLSHGLATSPWVWASALARLQDPTTYDALRSQLVRSRGNRAYYELMSQLPGMDLDAAVVQAWEVVAARPMHERELRNVSIIAVRHGHKPALEVLIDSLPTGDDANADSSERQIRRAVLNHTATQGENRELKQWWKDYRTELIFNRQTREFYVASGMM